MRLVNFFLPTSCLICDSQILYDKYNQICNECYQKIEWITSPHCKQCCSKFDIPALHNHACQNCQHNKWSFDQLVACAKYDQLASKIAIKLKHKGIGAKFIARLIFKKLQNQHIHLILPVPLHPMRAIKRGFNQSLLIAKHLGHLLNVPVHNKLLLRSKNTRSQDGLGQLERAKNLENAFALHSTFASNKEFTNLNVLLVDDIVTTNATIEACCKTLKPLGCNIIACCWAKRILFTNTEEDQEHENAMQNNLENII